MRRIVWGGSEVLVLQRRFSDLIINETDCSPTIEAGGGEGGNNLPMILESNQNHAVAKETEISPSLPASMGMGGGYVPMIVEIKNAESNRNIEPRSASGKL